MRLQHRRRARAYGAQVRGARQQAPALTPSGAPFFHLAPPAIGGDALRLVDGEGRHREEYGDRPTGVKGELHPELAKLTGFKYALRGDASDEVDRAGM